MPTRQRWPSREGRSKHTGLRAGRDHAALVVALAAVVEEEQVDLVVARHARAIGREGQRAVEHMAPRRRSPAAACRRRSTGRTRARRRPGSPAPCRRRRSRAARSCRCRARPIMQKYSGSTASSAPAAAASASSAWARARLASRAMADTIWMAATFMCLVSVFRVLARGRLRLARLRQQAGAAPW